MLQLYIYCDIASCSGKASGKIQGNGDALWLCAEHLEDFSLIIPTHKVKNAGGAGDIQVKKLCYN